MQTIFLETLKRCNVSRCVQDNFHKISYICVRCRQITLLQGPKCCRQPKLYHKRCYNKVNPLIRSTEVDLQLPPWKFCRWIASWKSWAYVNYVHIPLNFTVQDQTYWPEAAAILWPTGSHTCLAFRRSLTHANNTTLPCKHAACLTSIQTKPTEWKQQQKWINKLVKRT